MTGTINFEVGKIYLDREDNKYKVLAVDSPHVHVGVKQPIIGMDIADGKPANFTTLGSYIADDKPRQRDLVSEYKEPEYRWYNVYKDGWVNSGYRSKEACEEAAATLRSSRIALVKVNKQTGEVSNEPLV